MTVQLTILGMVVLIDLILAWLKDISDDCDQYLEVAA